MDGRCAAGDHVYINEAARQCVNTRRAITEARHTWSRRKLKWAAE
jgi:hypothetical protein